MENITQIANLLGEDNEKRLKDKITDLIMEDRYKYDYILAFDSIYEEVKEKIEEEFKEKLMEKYRERMNKELEKIFP